MEGLKPYDVNDAEFIREKELARLRAQADLFWPKEFPVLSRFGLKDAMSVLEVGSGPGFITSKILKALPECKVTGVELDPTLVADARQHLQSLDLSVYAIANQSITDADIASGSFDFAYARLVFQHLPNPVLAATKIIEALKPGGSLCVTDIDLDILAIVDPLPPSFGALQQKREQFMATRGSDRKIGRKLWRILKQAGYRNLRLELIAAHSDESGIDKFLGEFDPETLVPLVQLGVLTEADVAEAEKARRGFLSSDPFLLIPFVMVCGDKPR